jgi:hypothetical protein
MAEMFQRAPSRYLVHPRTNKRSAREKAVKTPLWLAQAMPAAYAHQDVKGEMGCGFHTDKERQAGRVVQRRSGKGGRGNNRGRGTGERERELRYSQASNVGAFPGLFHQLVSVLAQNLCAHSEAV